MSAPELSVIISLHDHGQLVRSLDALAHQTADTAAFDVIVVDPDHSLDSEGIIKRALATSAKGLAVRYVRIPKVGRAAAQNRGVRESSADLLLFLGDDFVPTLGFVEAHLRAHQDHPGDHIVAIGPSVFPPDMEVNDVMKWLEESGSLFGVSFTRKAEAIPETFFYGANTSIRRSFLLGAGGFDEEFPYDAWDDYELGLRLAKNGLKTVYAPDAAAYHYHMITLDDRRTSIRRAGESAAIFDAKYPPPQPWHKDCVRHPSWIGLTALWSLCKFKLRRRPQDRNEYYERVLTRSFVAGYRKTAAMVTPRPTT